MKRTSLSIAAAAAAFLLVPGALISADEKNDADTARRAEALSGKFSSSVVSVDFFFKLDESGKAPEYSIRYLCPNCGSYHTRSVEDSLNNEKPARAPGFAVAPDKVITTGADARPKWIDKVEVVFNGKSYPAEITSVFPDGDALEITLKGKIEGLTPLVFDSAKRDSLTGFFIIDENGMEVSGIRTLGQKDIRRNITSGFDYFKGIPNSVIIGADDRAAGLSFKKDLRSSNAVSDPAKWKKVPYADYEKALEKIENDITKTFYPVRVTLNSEKNKKPGRTRFSSSDDDDDDAKNEFDAVSALMPDGRLMAFLKLTPVQTARFANAVVTLPDGTKISAGFAGSLKKYGIVFFKPETPIKDAVPVKFPKQRTETFFDTPALVFSIDNFDGRISARGVRSIITGFDRSFRNYSVPEAPNMRSGDFVFTANMELLAMPVERRSNRDRYGNRVERTSVEALSDMLALKKPFDAANAPRSEDMRDKMSAYLGADLQRVTAELAKANNATKYTSTGNRYDSDCGVLITRVMEGLAADKAGLKAGDIIIYIRGEDEQERVKITSSEFMENPFSGQFPWDRYDEIPEQYYDQIPLPWGDFENGINKLLSSFGIGSDVMLGVVRNGEFSEKKLAVIQPPDSFRNATRFRSKTLGLTVADLTFEVRDYFKMAKDAPGVIAAKIKSGGAASVAGIKPYEVITSVNGTPVKSAVQFKELVADKDELSLEVKRLAATRVVKIKAKTDKKTPDAAAAPAESAPEGR